MSKIDCRGGNTQIGKVLAESRREAVASGVRAVVFVGDAMEEPIDQLCAKAGELGLLRVPVFMFQEGHDEVAEQAFREIARLTGRVRRAWVLRQNRGRRGPVVGADEVILSPWCRGGRHAFYP